MHAARCALSRISLIITKTTAAVATCVVVTRRQPGRRYVDLPRRLLPPLPPSPPPSPRRPFFQLPLRFFLPLLPREFDIQIVLVWVRIPLLILPNSDHASCIAKHNAYTIKLSVPPPRHVPFRKRRRRGSNKTRQMISQPTSWILRLRVLRPCRPSSCRAAAAAASSACAGAI
eukprot:COSAG06_NODE_273_length_18671_cov_15.620201_12_plen_173_part_00